MELQGSGKILVPLIIPTEKIMSMEVPFQKILYNFYDSAVAPAPPHFYIKI
jgi:hypothetical protein